MGDLSVVARERIAWLSMVRVLVGVCLALAGAEVLLRVVAPLRPRIREVDQGVAELAASDPNILVLGSSHARSFETLGALLADRSGGTQSLVVVPEEGGTFYAFDWVLGQRLRPLIEETDSTGRLARGRLSRVLLITTYWDMCPPEHTHVATNIPARAWTLRHFLKDVSKNGVTDFNRNYIESRWKGVWSFSDLMRDRGSDHIRRGLLQAIGLERRRSDDERRQERLKTRRSEFEEDFDICDDPAQKASLQSTLDYLLGRNLEVIVVSFPLVQEGLTDAARETTVRRYTDFLGELARNKPIRVVDISLGSPLVVGDFEPDLDHLTRSGNRKFAAWALDNDLAFLLEPAAKAHASAPRNP